MSDATHLVLAHYYPAPGKQKEVLELLAQLAAASRTEPGNRGYDYFIDGGGTDEILIVERYRRAGDFQSHRESAHFQRLGVEQIIPLLAQRRIEEIPLAGSGDEVVG